MKLSEEQLNKVYERNDRLGDFLDGCAIGVFSHSWKIMDYDVTDLPDQDIIDLVDWWKKKQSEQKYTVQVIKGNCDAFLNVDEVDDMFFDGEQEDIGVRTRFTKQEIEKLKQRDDLAIDWNKAIIEPVEESK